MRVIDTVSGLFGKDEQQYWYLCRDCGAEVVQRADAADDLACPECGGRLRPAAAT